MFEPDGSGTQAVLWLLALAALLGFVYFGHVIGKRGWKHMAARFAALCATTLVVVLAFVSTLNAHYGWYSSWQDLNASLTGEKLQGKTQVFGAAPKDGKPTQLTFDGPKAAKLDRDANEKYAADRVAFEKSMHLTRTGAQGQWIKVNVPGIPVEAKDVGRVMIWLPQAYMDNPTRTFPVIQAFHGMPGGTLDYKRVFKLDQAVTTAVGKKQVQDAIIIVAQQMPKGIDTECVNGGGLNMETWLTQTVPDWAIKHLRVRADRNSWVALGVSAGGWCATMSGLLHPDRYAGIVSLGGYFKPIFDTWNPFEGKPVPPQYDLTKRVAEHPTRQAIWLLISGADKLSGTASADFAKAVKAPTQLTTMDYAHAGHRVDVWVQALPDVLQWMGTTLPAFAPTK